MSSANAVQAGFADPRFPASRRANSPGSASTFRSSRIRGRFRAGSEAALVGALEPDRDGLILGVGRRRALFLPSVWRQLPDAGARSCAI